MNLKKAITQETICLHLKGNTKPEIIEELVDLLVSAGKIRDRKSAIKAILEREKKMSTGMQNGIAIPHGKTDTLEGLVAALGVKKDGVDFQSLDGQPSRIFVITLSPVNRTGPHIQFMAEISRLLNTPEIRERVLNAQNEDEIAHLLASA